MQERNERKAEEKEDAVEPEFVAVSTVVCALTETMSKRVRVRMLPTVKGKKTRVPVT